MAQNIKNDIKKDTMRMKVKRYIMSMITSGELKPGDRLVETRLAKELNVSQAPVREALLELSFMGLLEERAYSGTYVRSLNPDDIEDLFDTRACIEQHAAEKAAKNRTEQDLKVMDDILNKMEECQEVDEFLDLDNDFHTAMVKSSHSRSLQRVRNILQTREWTYESGIAMGYSLDSLRKSHRNIFECIKLQDERLAGALAYEHIKGFGYDLLKVIDKLQNENENTNAERGQ